MQKQAEGHEPDQVPVHDRRAACNTTGEPGVFWDRSGDRYRAIHIPSNGARRQFYTTSMAEAKLFVQSGEKPKRSAKPGTHARPSASHTAKADNDDAHQDGDMSSADSNNSDAESEQCESEVESDH